MLECHERTWPACRTTPAASRADRLCTQTPCGDRRGMERTDARPVSPGAYPAGAVGPADATPILVDRHTVGRRPRPTAGQSPAARTSRQRLPAHVQRIGATLEFLPARAPLPPPLPSRTPHSSTATCPERRASATKTPSHLRRGSAGGPGAAARAGNQRRSAPSPSPSGVPSPRWRGSGRREPASRDRTGHLHGSLRRIRGWPATASGFIRCGQGCVWPGWRGRTGPGVIAASTASGLAGPVTASRRRRSRNMLRQKPIFDGTATNRLPPRPCQIPERAARRSGLR